MENKRKNKISNKQSNKYLLNMSEDLYTKYFPQNKSIDYKKLKMSNVSLYSMDLPSYIETIANLIKSYFHKNKKITITDGTAHVGGASINFAKYFDKVNSVELDNFHCELLKNNVSTYELNDKITIFCNDYLKIIKELKQDVIFFDPPWGGKSYKNNLLMDLYMSNVNLIEIINNFITYNKNKKKNRTSLIIFKIPKNYNVNKFLANIKHDKITLLKITKNNSNYTSYNVIILEL